MTARKLYQAGYKNLVPVVPPDADLSPTTSLSPEARGKVPGKPRRDGLWVGYPWTKQEMPSESDIQEWESWGANIGLHAKMYPALDVDVDHPQLARFVVQEAIKRLGSAPIRTSREPRKCLVYRTDDPFSRMRCEIEYGGDEHTVEMLGEGRQYLVHGDHPSGSTYGWQGKALWDWDPDSLSTVSAEDVRSFFEHLRDQLSGRATVTLDGDGDISDPPPQETLRAPDLGALRSVVEKIPNDYEDRDAYMRVGYAVKAAGGEEAFDIWLDWTQRWTEGTNDPETARKDWDGMHAPYRVGWDYLQDLAAERSDYSPAEDAFEADLEPTEARGTISGLLNYTDSWVVEKLARRLADRVRYVPESGRYHIWGEG